jgi:predicted transcriptional regulator
MAMFHPHFNACRRLGVAEDDMTTDVREIAGAIVASYLENNQMPADQVPPFIRSVIGALNGGNADTATSEPETATPAAPAQQRVGDDHVTCLVCGKRMKALKRHIRTAHGMDEQDYRETFDLPREHPLVSRNYSKERAALAKRIGLGEKRKDAGRPRKKA